MARRDRRPPASLRRRRVEVRRPRKTLLVFCEGRRTEPEYLEALKREPSVREVAAVDLRIETRHAGSVPLRLVQLAVDARKRADREEAEIDEVWCVFDVEWPHNHPGLAEALALAQQHGVKLAVSNPCFELWLVLHFQDHHSWLDNRAARELRRRHDRSPDKGLDGSTYMPRRLTAADRAAALDRRHTRDGVELPRNNPSSGMHLLLAAVSPPPSDP